MQSKKYYSTAKIVFAIFTALLLTLPITAQPAQAQKFKVLHTFDGANGNGPTGVLVRDAAGNLYGTTEAGGMGKCGTYGCGTVFKLNKNGKQVWLHSFDITDGEEPIEGLIRDAAGNLYGTASLGGNSQCSNGAGCGVVFELDSRGQESVLYKFKKPATGYQPESVPARDSAGNLYGVTRDGGKKSVGTVFKVDANGKETLLHSFTGGADGCTPVAGLILDASGNLYGATASGGLGVCDEGYGVVFKVDAANGTLTVLYQFLPGDGAYPGSVLLLDEAGNLYGTTEGGGSSSGCGSEGCGVVFELSPQTNGTWTEKVLYNFCSLSECNDGEEPKNGPLVRDSRGNLYGTTIFGGTSRNCNGRGCGTVFKLDTAGQETVLRSFEGQADGAVPAAGLVTDGSGNLYGVAQNGGDNSCNPPDGCGTVFKIAP